MAVANELKRAYDTVRDENRVTDAAFDLAT